LVDYHMFTLFQCNLSIFYIDFEDVTTLITTFNAINPEALCFGTMGHQVIHLYLHRPQPQSVSHHHHRRSQRNHLHPLQNLRPHYLIRVYRKIHQL